MDSSAKEFIDDIMDDLQVDAGDVGDFDGDGQEEDESFKLDFDIDVSSLMPNANFQEQMMDLEDVINEDDETEDDDDDDSFTDDDSELEDDDDNDDNEEPTTSTPSTTTTTTATATSAKKLDSTLSQFKNLSQQKQDKILNKEDEQFDIDRISKLSKAANSKKSKSSSAGGSGGDADADQKKKQVRTSARSRDLSRLPKETKDLISRGMNQYTNGELKEAFLTFQEVIRVSPRYPRTYTMMSLIKKDEGDPYGECDFLYIAAEIGENLPDLWKRCADLSKQLGDYKRAIKCYKRVLKLDKDDLESLYSLSQVYESEKNYKLALIGFRYLHEMRPQDSNVTQQLVQVLTAMDKLDEAVSLMESIINKELQRSRADFYDLDLDSFNLILELYNRARYFDKTITAFQKVRALFPNNLDIAPDLVYSAAIAYIEINDPTMANICIKEITKHPVNDIPDIYYKLGSRLIELDHHEKALPLFLELLNKAENLEYEFIWLKLGTIYKALNNYQLAIKYLQDFIDAEPTNKEACLLLSDIYKETGDHEKSLQLLTQADNNNTSEDSEKGKFESTLNDLESKRLKATQQDIKELFKVADDFMNLSKYPQFLGISRALLNGSGDNVRLKKKTVLGGALTMRSVPRRIDRYIRHVSHRSNQPFAERLDEKDYFFLVTNTCKVLLLFHRYDEASTFLRYALRNIRFVTQAYSHQLNFLLVGIAFNVSRPLLAFSHFKYVCTKKPFSNRIWNLFNKVVLMSKGDYFFTHKDFIRKLLNENPTSLPMRIITGNSQKTTGNAKSALLEYLRAFKCQPEDPLVNLLISVTILCQSLGRKNPDRHKIVLTAFSFFYKYKMIRQNKELQEVYYNLGRAAHQLGMFYLAIDYYQKVLGCKDEEDSDYTLKQEAAFNLSLIYKEDNPELASQLIKQYCTI